MKVREVMTENPACCATDMSLQNVAHLMAENDCGCIPVVDTQNHPVGMITDRDIAIRTVAQGKNPLSMVAGEVMTTDVITVTPETSVGDCCAKMEKSQVRRIAVVDDRGAICGMVAQADVANYASQNQATKVVKEVSKSA